MAKTKFARLTSEGKETGAISIDLGSIKSPDPLAYAYGFAQGQRGDPISKDKDLAPEYIRGYKEGKAKMKRLI